MARLDVSLVNRRMFANTRSYQAAVHAINICNKIIDKIDNGYLVFKNGYLHSPIFTLNVVPHRLELLERMSSNMDIIVIGDEHNGEGLICCTKGQVNAYFGNYGYTHKRNLKRFK